jgi:serine/threonine protein kinase
MAPEILEGKAYDARCDYWSFGIMWFQMICAVLPFKGCDKDEILAKIKVGKYEFPKDLNVTRLGRNFLKGCLKYDVNERFTWQ